MIADNKKQKTPLAFYPIKKDKTFKERICALDLETDGLGGNPLCVSWCILDYQGNMIDSGVDADPGFIGRLLRLIVLTGPDCIWYSHNAQYDWRYLMDAIIAERDYYKPEFGMRAENVVYQMILRPFDDIDAQTTLRDSYALWADTLSGLTKTWAPEHAKLSGAIDFETETFNINDQKHLDYALRDSESLALAMFALNKKIEELYGVPLGHTVAGTAMKAWRRTLDETHYANRASLEFCRRAYYGGIVFLTDTNQHEKCDSYDINSSYPAVMQTKGVPVGTPIKTKAWHDSSFPAIYHCCITSPDDLRIPIIPSRNAQGHTRWLSGRIETVCTNAEIEFALAHGYTDLEILDGRFWEEFGYPFDEFVEKAKRIRAAFKGTPSEQLAKRIQNSLYGKMGTRQERTEVFIPLCPEDTENAQPIDSNDIYWARKEHDDSILCNPAWAAFITAFGRLALLSVIYDSVGVVNVLYGDTDSITVKSGADVTGIPIGDEYGQFKRDKQWAVFRAIAPKVYAGKLQNTDKWSGACKGIPLKVAKDHFETLYTDKLIRAEYESLQSFYVGLKKGFTPAHKVARLSTDIVNSGSWDLREDGSIWPKRTQ